MGHFIASGGQKLLLLVGRVGTQSLPVPISPNEFENDWLHRTCPLTNGRFFDQRSRTTTVPSTSPIRGDDDCPDNHQSGYRHRHWIQGSQGSLTAQRQSKTCAQRPRNPVVRRDILEECGHAPRNHCGRGAGATMELARKRQIWHGACRCASVADATSPNGLERPRRPLNGGLNDEATG